MHPSAILVGAVPALFDVELELMRVSLMAPLCGSSARMRLSVLGAIFSAKNAQAPTSSRDYPRTMDRFTELPVSLPGLHAVRGTTTSLHVGVKDHYGVGRIERGDTEWWGGGRVWRSAPGCILVKEPGDVVRHLAHRGQTTYTAVALPTHEVDRVRDEGRAVAIPQLDVNDERAAPFHRLIDAVYAGVDRLSLEVALAEAVGALAVISNARPDYSRPVRRALEYSASGSATRSRSSISRTMPTSTNFICAAPFGHRLACRRIPISRTFASPARRNCSIAASGRQTWHPKLASTIKRS